MEIINKNHNSNIDFNNKINILILKFKSKTIFKYGNAKIGLILQRKAYFCGIEF